MLFHHSSDIVKYMSVYVWGKWRTFSKHNNAQFTDATAQISCCFCVCTLSVVSAIIQVCR